MDLRPLTDDLLLARLEALAASEREALADIVAHIMEVDRREIVKERGYQSLYDFCTKKLGYSEQAAFSRIRAARAAERFPELLAGLREGSLHLEAVVRLSPYLNDENKTAVLQKAANAPKRKVLELVADLGGAPPPAPDTIRPLALQTRPDVIAPPRRLRFEFEADDELVLMVDTLKSLLRHKFPFARLEDVFKESARALLDRLNPARAPKRPAAARPPSGIRRRRVPAAVRRLVWARDQGKCVYVSNDGRRCGSEHALQYDHLVPWALGGPSDDPSNIRLLCRPHNLWLAKRRFGPPPSA